jgi:hypothetical protein
VHDYGRAVHLAVSINEIDLVRDLRAILWAQSFESLQAR